MVFSCNFSLPSREEIEAVNWMAESCPEFLDGRELWIFQTFCEVFE